MTDQANDLRKLIRTPARHAAADSAHAPPRLIVVASGKSGSGTTTVAVNLAAALARDGRRTVLVDADMQHADATKLCHVETVESIADVLAGRRSLHEALTRGPGGVLVLPGVWGHRETIDGSPRAQQRLLDELNCLGAYADFVVIDAGSNADGTMARFWEAADRVLLVTTPDTMAIMDTYAMIKSLATREMASALCTFVNAVPNARVADDVHDRLARAAKRFLGIAMTPAGCLSQDAVVGAATADLQVLLTAAEDSVAAKQFEHIAQQLAGSSTGPTGWKRAA
ncbi:MAG TPA: AAA family ATPase [Pirellulales bacterium]|jgi:MinD-like ATPase involved in chromosome partitioning or flagellar assembly|nr:AAA family ATPase [Pirellulales bacterium]